MSPGLSRYRALGKDLKTGPGAIILVSPFAPMTDIWLNELHLEKWLRSNSGIDKKYLEGEAYKVLRTKIKSSCRYARSEVKDVVRVHILLFVTC